MASNWIFHVLTNAVILFSSYSSQAFFKNFHPRHYICCTWQWLQSTRQTKLFSL